MITSCFHVFLTRLIFYRRLLLNSAENYLKLIVGISINNSIPQFCIYLYAVLHQSQIFQQK